METFFVLNEFIHMVNSQLNNIYIKKSQLYYIKKKNYTFGF